MDDVLFRLPFRVEKVQTDNGAEFQSQSHLHLLDQGITTSTSAPERHA